MHYGYRQGSSTKIAWLIGVACSGLLIVASAFSSKAAPTISWQPEKVTATISAGASNAIPVTFTSSDDLVAVSIRVVPVLQPFVKVEPASLSSINNGQSIQLTLILNPSATTLPQIMEGTIQVRSATDPEHTLARPLPVSLTVTWATYTNADTGVQLKYPDFGTVTRIDTTAGVAGGTMLDVQFQPPGETNFVSGFGILLISNPNHLTLADWFHQNIDSTGVLISNGSFTSSIVNGMDVLLLSGAIPSADLDESGPVADVYALSASQNTIVVLTQSQTGELDSLGLTADQKKEMFRQILTNLQVP